MSVAVKKPAWSCPCFDSILSQFSKILMTSHFLFSKNFPQQPHCLLSFSCLRSTAELIAQQRFNTVIHLPSCNYSGGRNIRNRSGRDSNPFSRGLRWDATMPLTLIACYSWYSELLWLAPRTSLERTANPRAKGYLIERDLFFPIYLQPRALSA